MTQIRAICIDDEKNALYSLQQDISRHCPEVDLVAACLGAKEGIKQIHRLKPDLVFLDIDMPFINGFELLELVPDLHFKVIFTTAYDKYALKAFKISATDYLLKPVDPNELMAAVQKVQLQVNNNPQNQIEFLFEQIKRLKSHSVQKVALPIGDGYEFVNLIEIIFCKSDGSYTDIFLEGNRKLTISKNLRFIEDILEDFNFLRVHNSFMINTDKVGQYHKSDGGYIIMSNGERVSISRSKKEAVLSLLKQKR